MFSENVYIKECNLMIKKLIRLICLILVVAFFGVWAFNGIVVFTANFNRPDRAVSKDGSLGTKYVAVYTVSAENEDDTDFDVRSAAENAVDVFRARIAAIGYKGATVRLMGNDKIRLELPGTSSTDGFTDFFENNGVLDISDDGTTVFTNADVKSTKLIGYDQEAEKFYAQITLNSEAAERLKNITSNGAYSLDVKMDDAVSVTYSGSAAVKNGKMKIAFDATNEAYADALALVYCVGSGAVDGTITPETDMGMILTPDAGTDVIGIIGIGLLAIFAVAAVYFIISKKLMGVATAFTALMAVIVLDFFASTFSWFQASGMGFAGLCVGLLVIIASLEIAASAVYRQDKTPIEAINAGIAAAMPTVLAVDAFTAGAGVLLWIGGHAVSDFGMALLGGGVIAFLASIPLLKHVLKLIIGLKRGE